MPASVRVILRRLLLCLIVRALHTSPLANNPDEPIDTFSGFPTRSTYYLADLTLVNVDSGEIKVVSFPPGQTLPKVQKLGSISPDGKKVLVETAVGLGVITLSK